MGTFAWRYCRGQRKRWCLRKARCHSSCCLEEVNFTGVVALNTTGNEVALMADSHPDYLGGRGGFEPVAVASNQSAVVQSFVSAEDNAVGMRVDVQYVGWITKSDTQSAPLADGVATVVVVMSHQLALLIDDFARCLCSGTMGPNEGGMVIIGDKTHFLTFGLLGDS